MQNIFAVFRLGSNQTSYYQVMVTDMLPNAEFVSFYSADDFRKVKYGCLTWTNERTETH